MSQAYPLSTTEHHVIERHGKRSYWVARYADTPGHGGRAYSRIVYFARNQRDAERYIQGYSNPN